LFDYLLRIFIQLGRFLGVGEGTSAPAVAEKTMDRVFKYGSSRQEAKAKASTWTEGLEATDLPRVEGPEVPYPVGSAAFCGSGLQKIARYGV
jgi:hypothetical protein